MLCRDEPICAADLKESLDLIDNLPLMSSPYPMLAITGAYLLFVLRIGPDYMKNRQPYSLRGVIVLYNIVQVFVSTYIVYLACKLSWPYGWISKTCALETKDTRDAIITVAYYYFLAKLSEVLDTVFFIFRKKYNQVSFLHVYHHSMIIVVSWAFLKYEPTYPTIFLRNINSFVHIIMYLYYALSSFPSLTKYLWWKKYITTLQLVQFILVMIHALLTFATSECTPSYPVMIVTIWNAGYLCVLFTKFYLNTYNKKSSKKVK